VYRAQFGLPACNGANGCFTKVNERGDKTDDPEPDPGWSLEISLALDAVSATCPSCHLRLLEADVPATQDLVVAVQTAHRLGANAISNSYGTLGEFASERLLRRSRRGCSWRAARCSRWLCRFEERGIAGLHDHPQRRLCLWLLASGDRRGVRGVLPTLPCGWVMMSGAGRLPTALNRVCKGDTPVDEAIALESARLLMREVAPEDLDDLLTV
jgi:hypothetical protein